MTNSNPSDTVAVPGPSMPAGTSGPQPGSWANVVSGRNGSYPGRANGQPGDFSHLLNHPDDYLHANREHGDESWRDLRASSSRNGTYSSWGRNGRLPSISSAYRPFMVGLVGDGELGDIPFVPSYLRGSTYMRRLQQTHRTRPAPLVEPVRPGSLSTSASSASLHSKPAPSHRGMTYDLIEKAPPLEDDSLTPLPSRWNTGDKWPGLEVLGEGQEVRCSSPRSGGERDHEGYSIRADHPMPTQCGLYYFEVTVISKKREDSSIAIGFSGKDVALSRPPGWEPDSWAYHGDDGHSFCCQSSGKTYGPHYTTNDIIGCGVNFRTGCAFFTKNGKDLGIAFREIKGRLFPSIGMKRSGEHIRVNFGQKPFVFDIDAVMNAEKHAIREKVSNTATSKIAPPLNETQLIQALVVQYLSHDGYVETARAFASEIEQEAFALNGNTSSTDPYSNLSNIKDDDAINRQRIRTSILNGNIDEALRLTNAYYPNVLKENEMIYFGIRSRKFVELLRSANIVQQKSLQPILSKKLLGGNSGNYYDEAVQATMDLDDPPLAQNGFDKMDTSDHHDVPHNDYDTLLKSALDYGSELQNEWKDDPRQEVRRALADVFSLFAYKDPMNEPTVRHLLDPKGRLTVAEELNSAILVSLGKSSCAALERLIQQTTVLIDDLRENGGLGAFVNVAEYMKPEKENPVGYMQ